MKTFSKFKKLSTIAMDKAAYDQIFPYNTSYTKLSIARTSRRSPTFDLFGEPPTLFQHEGAISVQLTSNTVLLFSGDAAKSLTEGGLALTNLRFLTYDLRPQQSNLEYIELEYETLE